jgi:hypothetical protein
MAGSAKQYMATIYDRFSLTLSISASSVLVSGILAGRLLFGPA